jgi:N-ethylmaleimide reductase
LSWIWSQKKADLIAVGRPFLTNQDLVERWKNDLELNAADFGSFYTPGENGHIEFQSLKN